MSTALPKSKVEEAIARLPKDLRDKARKMFHKTMPYRHGSETYARKHPELAVSASEKAFFYKLRRAGCSFREIEEIGHLYPNSGNDAYRIYHQYEDERKGKGRLSKQKPRHSKTELRSFVKAYAEQRKPKQVIAEFKEIIAVLSSKKKASISSATAAAVS